MSDRDVEIEIRFTHLSRDLEKLNEAVVEQSREILRLQGQLLRLEAKLDAALLQRAEGGAEGPDGTSTTTPK